MHEDDPRKPLPIQLEKSSAAIELPPSGYELGEVIGRGGMGEVIAAQDLRIGRDVALKRLRDAPTPTAIARFLREARVQARLDHPAVVPVHELGTDEAGRPFFTMKRLVGVTLGDRLTPAEPTQALLRAFVEVCHAIELAHARGIVHRDLKPANIMLGDYGEVYVLDWGLARVLSEPPIEAASEVEAARPAAEAKVTRVGAVLGTPGYMAPEQVRGDEVGCEADIYALGAILFEILVREPLHPPGEEALISTLTSPTESPAKRAGDRGTLADRTIPPELDDVCRACLAEEPAERPSAAELADRLHRYLDGDRDLERRRTLANEQLAQAAAASTRATALRHAGRALALDPESPAAAGVVTRLLFERPAEHPPDLRDSLEELDRIALRTRQRRAAISYGSVFAFLLLLPFVEVRSWFWLSAFYGMLGAMFVFAWRGIATGRVSPHLSMLGNFLLALVWTRIASPLVLTPVMICGASIAIASHPWNQQRPWSLYAWIAVTAVAPFVLEAVGVFESTWHLENGSVVFTSSIYALRGWSEVGAVLLANVVFMLLVGSFSYTITKRARDAQREMHVQAWHLRQLLPDVPTA